MPRTIMKSFVYRRKRDGKYLRVDNRHTHAHLMDKISYVEDLADATPMNFMSYHASNATSKHKDFERLPVTVIKSIELDEFETPEHASRDFETT